MSAAPGWMEVLLRNLASAAPAEALILAPPGHPLIAAARARVPGCAFQTVAPDAVPGLGSRRVPVALVAGALERLAPDPARQALAALRDRLSAHTLVVLDTRHSPLDDAELRALGYRTLARDPPWVLLGFDLYDYKDRPEWLNPRHWAHPELWDKFRW